MSDVHNIDEELSAFIAQMCQRAARWATNKTMRHYPVGPRALERMSTARLVTETTRRLGQAPYMTEAEKQRFAQEYNRRGLDKTATTVRDPLAPTAAVGGALAGVAAAQTLDKEAVAQAINQTAAEHNETEALNNAVVTEPMTPDDHRADMLDAGMSEEAANAVAFAQQHSPRDLGAAIAQQNAHMPLPEVADAHRAELDSTDTLAL